MGSGPCHVRCGSPTSVGWTKMRIELIPMESRSVPSCSCVSGDSAGGIVPVPSAWHRPNRNSAAGIEFVRGAGAAGPDDGQPGAASEARSPAANKRLTMVERSGISTLVALEAGRAAAAARASRGGRSRRGRGCQLTLHAN